MVYSEYTKPHILHCAATEKLKLQTIQKMLLERESIVTTKQVTKQGIARFLAKYKRTGTFKICPGCGWLSIVSDDVRRLWKS